MKKLLWFTETNINHIAKKSTSSSFEDITTDLTPYLKIFIEGELWKKEKYRNEYRETFEKSDLLKIENIKVNIHNKGYPFSNFRGYENLINSYINKNNIEKEKIISSGIKEASKIAVIEVDYNSNLEIIKNLTYEQETDIDAVFESLSDENQKIWIEQNIIKSITYEILQFYLFNLHLNFLTRDYEFNFLQKANPVGFIAVTSDKFKGIYYETDKLDLLTHYILWEKEYDVLESYMELTSKIWCQYINSIHFFLDALKGNFITSSNFLKLVFTLESFFSKNSSNDFVSLVTPLIISPDIQHHKEFRDVIRKSFQLRNEIVHGGKFHSMKDHKEMSKLFFELKNVIIRVFAFFINKELYLNKTTNPKLNHELIFKLLPNGIK